MDSYQTNPSMFDTLRGHLNTALKRGQKLAGTTYENLKSNVNNITSGSSPKQLSGTSFGATAPAMRPATAMRPLVGGKKKSYRKKRTNKSKRGKGKSRNNKTKRRRN